VSITNRGIVFTLALFSFPFKNGEFLYLSGQMIWHTTENGISPASDVLSTYIYIYIYRYMCARARAWVCVHTHLPSNFVNRNRRFCGNDNIQQWNRTCSRKRTNCWDNNYSGISGLGLGEADAREEGFKSSFACVSGVIIDASLRTLFSWLFANVYSLESLLLNWYRNRLMLFPFYFLLISNRIYNWNI